MSGAGDVEPTRMDLRRGVDGAALTCDRRAGPRLDGGVRWPGQAPGGLA